MSGEKKIFNVFKKLTTIVFLATLSVASASANDSANKGADNRIRITNDVQDPLFLNRSGIFVSRSSADIGDYFQARQSFSYGLSNRFALSADIRYRLGDDDDNRNGWNLIGVAGTYRVGVGESGVTDIIFGYGYAPHGVMADYSNETYRVGFRTGMQMERVTLAATVMTNWVFHQTHGQAYIDLTPEAYFRIREDWSMGVGATLRKSTEEGTYNQVWLNYMVGKTVGKTGWFFTMGARLDESDFRIGGTINMLF